jgi:hypothetical protein
MFRLFVALMVAAGAAAPVQDAPEDNREYKAWASLKPGAWVKWKIETQTGAMKVQSELTTKLVRLNGEKAVLEEKTVISMSDGNRDHTGTREIPSKLKKGTNGDGDKFEVAKEGEDELEIKGRKIRCHWIETRLTDRQGASIKVWTADEIVGGIAKKVIKHDEAGKMGLTMTVVDWKPD